jgi:benzoyl-CoA reductase/2-hydroxyglutaryl-CoA dehydratase subunit BcrC/BadD/HgdB
MTSIAYTSPFIPVEWIAAHGLQPLWLRPRAASGRSAIAVARGICPYAGAVIDSAESGIEASGLVLTTICDQMRYAAAVMKSSDRCPIFLMNVPSTWQTEGVRKLYIEELRRLGRFLEERGGKSPRDAELVEVMLTYERARIELLSKRTELSARKFAEAIVEYRGSAVPHLGGISKSNRLKSGLRTKVNGIPLAVLGGPLLEADYEFFDVVENAGGRVVLDATEGGERTMPRKYDPLKINADPLQELADSYFDSIPDAFRRPNTGLYEWLGRELAERQVRGILFRRYVWCDLWHGELQRLKHWSPVPVLEIDEGADDLSAPNRMQGRIEAFLEMLA